MRWRLVFLAVSLLIFLVASSPSWAFADVGDNAKSAILAAEDEIVDCYGAVADADEAGANVTGLLGVLDESGRLLSKAKLDYMKENFDSALYFANESQKELEDFVAEAEALEEAALERGYRDFMVNVVGSFVGAGIVVCGGFVVWFFLKGRYSSRGLREYGVLFVAVVGVLALVVASPALSRLLVLPRSEFFTEFWILDANGRAEDYPFNISSSQNYGVFLGIGNRLGYCTYYLAEVKFRNKTMSAPNSFNRTPSRLPSLFNITAFVEDEGVWELPLTFSFDYEVNETLSRVEFKSLTLNDIALNMGDCTVAWDSTDNGFFGYLFFELWLYNGTIGGFQYHERFVSLKLNMTSF